MSEKFLKWFIKICGVIEIIIGISFIFLTPVLESIGLNTIPLMNQLAGVELALFGFLLWHSAKNIEKYQIILIASIALRFIMPFFEIYAALTIPQMMGLLIGASIYDLGSSALTLILLLKHGYLKST